MKAIATAPNKATKYVVLTTAEQAVIDADEAKNLAEKPMKDWQSKMQATDNDMPRWAEDIIDAVSVSTRGRIASYTIDKHTAKKTLRGKRPQ